MSPQADQSGVGEPLGDYRRLLASLAARGRRLGSRDPEAAAQEALKRSLENATSRPAIDYYFAEESSGAAPEWPLDQLFAWLHAVLRNVVREEQKRAGFQRELTVAGPERADPAPDPLEALLRKESESILRDCFPKLEHEYRKVLTLRARGFKYGEIATRMGVNANTVATWISRGIRSLGQLARERGGGSE